MVEVQHHGFVFQDWICTQFFAPFDSNYTDKWDVPASANHLARLPDEFRHLPVSIKACKFGSPLALGDARRQFAIDEDFLLIVGYWQQRGPLKVFVNAIALVVRAALWRSVFHPLTAGDLETFDEAIKDLSLTPLAARNMAKLRKQSAPFNDALIGLNPKIDSKKQRRLQCSLGFQQIWSWVEREPQTEPHPALFGMPLPAALTSGMRQFS